MKFPKILFAVVLIGIGIVGPFLLPPLDSPPHNVIGMTHEGYEVAGVDGAYDAGDMPVVTITVGDTLSFQNNSRWIHVIGPGEHGLLAHPGHGAMGQRELVEQDQVYTTPPWTTPGTYLITCSVHPDMDAKIIVVP